MVEVSKGEVQSDFHLRALALAVAEVSAAAEEAREEVEGVVGVLVAGTGFVLGEAFLAVLVVDLACGFVGERVVGFGYGDEFRVGAVVAAAVGTLVSELAKHIRS